MSDAKIIAVSGKGGVGKTTISAATVRILTEKMPGARILAVDADPAVGLATALGVRPERTLDDIRVEIVSSAASGDTKQAIELLNEAKFRIFDAITETSNFAFLAVGRPETSGCYCAINQYLKEVIRMISVDFDYIVIDGEAGIEQINRRVMERVTHLLLITDQSRKGVQVVHSIRDVAARLVMADKMGVIVNRVTSPDLAIPFDDLEVLFCIPADDAYTRSDIEGKSIFELSADSGIFSGVAEALKKLGII